MLPLFLRSSMALAAACCLPALLSAQGSLTPPGAPAPSMKSLAEVEPRFAVQSLGGDASAQYVISQPGSYYLIGNIDAPAGRAAVAIVADGVSLDLGGHALVGVSGATSGIEIRATRAQLKVTNGIIRGFTDAAGVQVSGSLTNSLFADLVISCPGGGVAIGGSGNSGEGVLVRDCTVAGSTNGVGIVLGTNRGTVERCLVSGLSSPGGTSGIVARLVSGCEVNNLGCAGAANTFGISAAGLVSRCVVNGLTGTGGAAVTGINASDVTGCEVANVQSASGSAIGISAFGSIAQCLVNGVEVNNGSGGCVGLSGGTVQGSRALLIGVNGRGTPTGILGAAVSDCSVNSVGGANSQGSAVGISANSVVSCTVSFVGHLSAGSATGIFGTAVSGCSVNTVNTGSGGAAGIVGSSVTGCTVATMNIGTGSGTGISSGEVVADCRVLGITSSSGGSTTGYAQYRLLRNCSATSITSTGGSAFGASTSQVGRTEGVSISLTAGVGISVNSNHAISGCTVNVGGGGTGVQATGTRNQIEGNHLAGNGGTGILASSGSNTAQALVVRNHVRGFTTRIQTDAPCQVGPSVTAAGSIASTSPWANFTD
ncbi:MAG: hypothetical protein JSR82_19220 [Verrucomicrobia bacterium]|nr:hypothetical protein [Verrucomicrobiota bacterium]